METTSTVCKVMAYCPFRSSGIIYVNFLICLLKYFRHLLVFLTARSCFLPLGMESGHIPDSAISASTYYDAKYIPQFSRLNKIPASGKGGSWCTRTNNGNEWLQVYFGRETTITKVATQWRYDGDERVTSYSLSYSADGSHWAWYRLVDGHIKVRNIISWSS